MAEDLSLFKDDLKSRIDIVDIIGEFIELKKRGSNHTGLCPFHNEKTPSFSVNRASQFYHCFGCGKGGDVISFLMDITGMGFIETVEQLADRLGMEMPKTRQIDPSVRVEKEQLVLANYAAAEYYHKALTSKEGKAGLDYLTGRGLSEDTIREFRLGYAPADPAGLVEFAKSKGVKQSSLETLGIVSAGYKGPLYNRFADRVMFPIIDLMKRVVGFGGRLLEGDGAKYLNSPESVIYHKSEVLFGIHQAKDPVKKLRKAIVVEGYMDVISMHQAGIKNVIAASGTSFTVQQGKIITRMARDVTLLFDGDKAGLAAAARGADNLLSTELAITVAVLPDGHDPDSYIQEFSGDALQNFIDNPLDLWEFKLQALGKGTTSVQDKIKLAGEIADSIALIPDELKRDVYIRDMSARVGVDIDSMYKAVHGRLRRRSSQREAVPQNDASGIGSQGERELLGYIIQYPELARHFMEEAGSKPFENDIMKKVADELFHRIVEGLEITPSALMSAITDQQAQELVASVSMLARDTETASRCIEDNIRQFRKKEIRDEIEEMNRRNAAESDTKKKKKLLTKRDELYARLKKLDANGATAK